MADSMSFEQKQKPQMIVIEQETLTAHDVPEGAVIGRKTEKHLPAVPLKQAFVSRKHGKITRDGGGFYYTDTDSANGSFLNGRRIESGRPYALHDRDLLVIYQNGNIETAAFAALVFCEKGITKAHSAFAEMIVAGYLNRLTFELSKRGDDDGAPGAGKEQGDSARKRQERLPGLHAPEPAGGKGEALTVDIRDRTVTVKGRKLTLLKDIRLDIPPGSITLILGGSGAGKTTLMNAITGYEKANGRVLLGTENVYENYGRLKSLIGTVPQQDLLRLNDSVYHTLADAAWLKLGRGANKREREERVKKTLQTLGLERERDHLARKLSGGQLKRLSVAVEYVSDPGIFFLDEPDSGLDGTMARALFRNLRVIADEGKIVMVISHGPDRHEALFDRVIVLAKSTKDNCGRLAFFGNVEEAYRFFETTSLEQIVQRINRPDEGGDGRADDYIEKYARMTGER